MEVSSGGAVASGAGSGSGAAACCFRAVERRAVVLAEVLRGRRVAVFDLVGESFSISVIVWRVGWGVSDTVLFEKRGDSIVAPGCRNSGQIGENCRTDGVGEPCGVLHTVLFLLRGLLSKFPVSAEGLDFFLQMHQAQVVLVVAEGFEENPSAQQESDQGGVGSDGAKCHRADLRNLLKCDIEVGADDIVQERIAGEVDVVKKRCSDLVSDFHAEAGTGKKAVGVGRAGLVIEGGPSAAIE